jgi:hypothetical protein
MLPRRAVYGGFETMKITGKAWLRGFSPGFSPVGKPSERGWQQKLAFDRYPGITAGVTTSDG